MSIFALAAGAIGIGFCTGLRCMTPICVLALMRIPVTGFFASVLFWPFHAVVFPLAAVGELIGDKLPKCPSRLEPPGLIGRTLFGGFCGAALTSCGGAPVWLGAVLGVSGAWAGAFLGNRFRGNVPKAWAWPAALAEDAICIVGAVVIVRLFV